METIGIFGTIFIGASLLLFVAAVVMLIWALYKVIKTKEEKREFDTKFHLSSQLVDDLYAYAPEIIKVYCEAISWLLAHHFDFMGLIDKGLAIDCTDLDIYKD